MKAFIQCLLGIVRSLVLLVILLFVLVPMTLWAFVSEPSEEDRIRDRLHPF